MQGVEKRKKKKKIQMIRWYDYIAALAVAYWILYFFFTIPIAGAIIAYTLYEYVWNHYCNYRLRQENQ